MKDVQRSRSVSNRTSRWTARHRLALESRDDSQGAGWNFPLAQLEAWSENAEMTGLVPAGRRDEGGELAQPLKWGGRSPPNAGMHGTLEGRTNAALRQATQAGEGRGGRRP